MDLQKIANEAISEHVGEMIQGNGYDVWWNALKEHVKPVVDEAFKGHSNYLGIVDETVGYCTTKVNVRFSGGLTFWLLTIKLTKAKSGSHYERGQRKQEYRLKGVTIEVDYGDLDVAIKEIAVRVERAMKVVELLKSERYDKWGATEMLKWMSDNRYTLTKE